MSSHPFGLPVNNGNESDSDLASPTKKLKRKMDTDATPQEDLNFWNDVEDPDLLGRLGGSHSDSETALSFDGDRERDLFSTPTRPPNVLLTPKSMNPPAHADDETHADNKDQTPVNLQTFLRSKSFPEPSQPSKLSEPFRPSNIINRSSMSEQVISIKNEAPIPPPIPPPPLTLQHDPVSRRIPHHLEPLFPLPSLLSSNISISSLSRTRIHTYIPL
jgi:hypothetical protein